MDTECIIFSRAPLPGECKIRLIPALGPACAAAVHSELTLRTVHACIAAFGSRNVLLAVTERHESFDTLRKDLGVRVIRQKPGDLGGRMHATLLSSLSYCRRAILVDTDWPAIEPAKLQHAMDALQRRRMVFGPAEDGGYVLVGASLLAREVFSGVRWGTPFVMADTREKLQKLGWDSALHWEELPTEWDIDYPADLQRAIRLGLLPASILPRM